ncbi:hypothetical protein TWF730_004631 [Orbilia blumenaviensis]|uniref:Uncharacterized protein n=1 Tax=Orbilia blumenaviensis TaxID=1796055 RepID=A0AAV9TY20_9PEZI
MTSRGLSATSLYRACLRELPPIFTPAARLSGSTHPNTAAKTFAAGPRIRRLPLHNYLRLAIRASHLDKPVPPLRETTEILRIQQMVKYLGAQRLYIELLERYNAGLLGENQDRIRRAARRVGLDIAE